ncbi:glycoside hydrolase family 2 [Planctomycetota bacterium]|nr:glycoside hydrolase family 2 [Planctomycetota bacterium]
MCESGEEMVYPRPQLERDGTWQLLDGAWDFANGQADVASPKEVRFDQQICVPFAPETDMSGVDVPARFMTCWYRRNVRWPREPGMRTHLHFEAVDQCGAVWVNGFYAGKVGGPVRSTLDISEFMSASEQEIIVRVDDDPSDMTKSRGKQDWREEAHIIWYPRTTGLWQSVWLENVPEIRIDSLRFEPKVTAWDIGVDVRICGTGERRASWDGWLEIKLKHEGEILADDRYQVCSGLMQRRIGLDDPGVIDERSELMWSPENPHLIDVELRLVNGDGDVIDHVKSYTAMRDVGAVDGRLMLNGMPYFSRMVLAQGYWEESGLTAPSDEALKNDVELAKALGFNGVRLHEKIESERYLYWADRLGLMVWGEMGSSYAFEPSDFAELQTMWGRRVERDMNHPCVVAWVPVNESWGFPALLDEEHQVHAMRSLYYQTKAIDPTRLVLSNDGWEMSDTDVIGVHDYEGDVERLRKRYNLATRGWLEILKQEQPGNRKLLLNDEVYAGQPVVLSEFGGVRLCDEQENGWGYSEAADLGGFAKAYMSLLRFANRKNVFSGFCYTQLTDTYQETNGLLKMDRTSKLPIEMVRQMTVGEHVSLPGGFGEAVRREGVFDLQ